ncbi:MAG: tripartite tricarboxylate transporter TctB family protein, partial [Actinobacteria bacterium]|nr:tripartite tricarboxylate transporter TctB family protein [Actinomycetota bacterium]
ASLLSIILIFDGFRKKDFTFNLIKLVKPILGLIFFIVFLVFWKWVGYFAACAALLMLWLRCIGREKWVISIVATVLVTLGFYAVFVILLDIPVPV